MLYGGILKQNEASVFLKFVGVALKIFRELQGK